MPKKKVNPRRVPISKAYFLKEKDKWTEEAVRLAWSIMFTVLRDKENHSIEDLQRIWSEVDDLSDSIAKGYCTVEDIREILREESGVDIV